MSEMWWGCLGLYLGMFWGVLRCSIVLKGVSGGSVLLGWNQGSAIIPFWNNFKRQDLFHPTHLRPQNIKTSLCKLSKNYWVMLYFVYFRSVRVKLQSTVSLDHPVSYLFHSSDDPFICSRTNLNQDICYIYILISYFGTYMLTFQNMSIQFIKGQSRRQVWEEKQVGKDKKSGQRPMPRSRDSSPQHSPPPGPASWAG